MPAKSINFTSKNTLSRLNTNYKSIKYYLPNKDFTHKKGALRSFDLLKQNIAKCQLTSIQSGYALNRKLSAGKAFS